MEKINNKDYGIVYVIHNVEFNIVKIGKTRDIKKRVLALSGGCGCSLEVVYTTRPLKDYSRIELETHAMFKEKRRPYGEWFNVSPNDVILYIHKTIKDEEENPISKTYREGVSASKIALKYGVSRVYIINLLKNWGVYKEKKSFSLLKRPIKTKTINKSKIFDNDLVPIQYRNSMNFTRVSANLYKHKVDDVYKTKQFVNGKIKESFFIEKSEAIASLNNN